MEDIYGDGSVKCEVLVNSTNCLMCFYTITNPTANRQDGPKGVHPDLVLCDAEGSALPFCNGRGRMYAKGWMEVWYGDWVGVDGSTVWGLGVLLGRMDVLSAGGGFIHLHCVDVRQRSSDDTDLNSHSTTVWLTPTPHLR